MKPIILTLALLFTFSPDATAQELNGYMWKSRLVLCFTPSPGDPLFERQVRLLYDEYDAFQDRDVTFIFITPDGKFENTGRFLDESKSRQYYEKFGVAQYQFEMILIGYDGQEKFRAKNRITPPSILVNLIDGMPMRKREMLQGYGNRSNISGSSKSASEVRRNF